MPRCLFTSVWPSRPFLVIVLLLCPLKAPAADPWHGKVVGIVDGATLDIAKPDGQGERARPCAIGVPPSGISKVTTPSHSPELSWTACR